MDDLDNISELRANLDTQVENDEAAVFKARVYWYVFWAAIVLLFLIVFASATMIFVGLTAGMWILCALVIATVLMYELANWLGWIVW
jgi:hypothetical protein